MRCLISGATGFIGSHLLKYLSDLGYEVDLISTSEFKREDWSKLDAKPDVVIHCAWIREPNLHAHEHLEFAEWSCNFLNECKSRGLRAINIGSSSEYGVKYEPMKEDMICEPINTYGLGKLMVTLHAKKLGYNTLRLFSVVGRGGKTFPSIYKKAKQYGNPNDTRDYVDDLIVCCAVERLIHAQHLYGEIINVCSGNSLRNIWVANDAPTKPNRMWYKYAMRQYEPSVWVGDATKMRRLLNL